MVQEKMDLSTSPICQLLQERHINLPFIKVIAPGECINMPDIMSADIKHPLLIADGASMTAALEYLGDSMRAMNTLILPAPAKPVFEKDVRSAMQKARDVKADAIIIIGSGSLSDIGKYVASQLRIPLIIIATAPSMNGYFSANASLVKDGLKQSFPCKLVDLLIFHEPLYSNAPKHMLAAGMADGLSSITASIDMSFANKCLGIEDDERIHAAQAHLYPQLRQPEKLMELLLLQGLAMTAAGSSAPASGGEHMLAHLWEMLNPQMSSNVLHGEIIASILPSYLTNQISMLKSKKPSIRQLPTEEHLEKVFSNHWPTIKPLYDKKIRMLSQHHTHMHHSLSENWQDFAASHMPKLEALEAYIKHYELGVSVHIEEALPALYDYAWLTRDRFTLLDITA